MARHARMPDQLAMFNRSQAFFNALLNGEVRLINYLLVGGVNTLFGYSVFMLMLWAGFHYSLAIAGSTILGILFNFKSTGVLVFKSHDNSQISRFVIVYALSYCLNVACVGLLIRCGINVYYSGAIMILPLALLTYRLNSQFVFKK